MKLPYENIRIGDEVMVLHHDLAMSVRYRVEGRMKGQLLLREIHAARQGPARLYDYDRIREIERTS